LSAELPRSIALLVHSLDGGGAERVVADLANTWAEAGVDVHLITLGNGDSDRYEVDPRVHRVALGLVAESRSVWQALRNNWSRARAVRQALRDCGAEVAVSFVDRMNVITLWAARRLKNVAVVACERTDFRYHQVGKFWDWQRRRTYPRARILVVQTDEVAAAAREWLPNVQVEVIPNAVPESATPRIRDGSEKTITWIGRMSAEKGVDDLIRAFHLIASELPNWTLLLVGDGPERLAIESLVQELQLENQVEFSGWQRELESSYERTSLFVLPSKYEGFPNVLLECMARGIPPISFDCPSGPRAIIRNETDGLLVPASDVEKLGATILRLATDSSRIQELSQQASQVRLRFGRDVVLQRWEQVLRAASSSASSSSASYNDREV
jgi:GalNAc-alpha-(1->4)-GalNAc-alpha-(1->3)-diNAcBac-PP-undecaprenol alpha-1,4-N-acetyl-D-galactosaminyltransferase